MQQIGGKRTKRTKRKNKKIKRKKAGGHPCPG